MYQRTNFAYGKVLTPPSPAASGTTIVLETGQGARFPNTTGGQYVCVVKETNLPATPDNAEVVLVTSHDPANDTFTVTREQEGSSARTIVIGDEFYLSPTDGVWDQLDVLTTKGDILSQSAAGTYARLGVGSNDQALLADSGETTGLKWGSVGSVTLVRGETPTGDIDGSNTSYTIANTPVTDSLRLYQNGVRLNEGAGNDYTISGTTITMATAPPTDDVLLVDYEIGTTGVNVLSTKGDIYTYDTNPQRLAVGTDDYFLVADSSQATGLKWSNNLDSPTYSGNLDGWIAVTDTWTYASATTFTIAGVDRTAMFPKGTKLKLTQTSAKYFYVVGSAFSTNTTITVTGGTDYTLEDAAITSPYYSYASTPQGFPKQFTYTPTWTCASGDAPAIENGILNGLFSIVDGLCYVRIYWLAGASTTFGTGPYNFALPVAAIAGYPQTLGAGRITDSGTRDYFNVVCYANAGASVVFAGIDATNVAYNSPCTFANGDQMRFSFIYTF